MDNLGRKCGTDIRISIYEELYNNIKDFFGKFYYEFYKENIFKYSKENSNITDNKSILKSDINDRIQNLKDKINFIYDKFNPNISPENEDGIIFNKFTDDDFDETKGTIKNVDNTSGINDDVSRLLKDEELNNKSKNLDGTAVGKQVRNINRSFEIFHTYLLKLYKLLSEKNSSGII